MVVGCSEGETSGRPPLTPGTAPSAPVNSLPRQRWDSVFLHARVIAVRGSGVELVTTPGRNDPCPCGSGQKYKKCCWAQEHAPARERALADHQRKTELLAKQRSLVESRAEAHSRLPAFGGQWYLDDLDVLSNSVLGLIAEQRYDEALVACERLLREYPDVSDGFERSARVHDALGNYATAASFWRLALDFIEHPSRRRDYDEGVIEQTRQDMLRSEQLAAQAAATKLAPPAEAEPAP